MRIEARIALSLALAWGASAAPCSVEAHAQGQLTGTVRNGGQLVGQAAVYLEPLTPDPTVRPDAKRTVDQSHLMFVPKVVVVTPGTPVEFLNSDDVLHNVFGPGFTGVETFDLGTYPRGAVRSWVFHDEGLHVVLCHIHPEMAAFIIVARTKHKTLTTADGRFTLEGVEPGRYRMHVWHPRYWRNELVREVTVRAGRTTDMTITLTGSTSAGAPR